MRLSKSLATLLLVFSLSLAFTACGDSASAATESAVETATETVAEPVMESATQTPHGEGKEYTSAYVCPMHCKDSGSDAAGDCPTCGMAYVTNEGHVENGHTH